MEAMDHEQSEPVAIAFKLVQAGPNLDFYTLHAAEQPCICPFQPVLPQYDERGHMLTGRGTCNTNCPLATVETRNGVAGSADGSPSFQKEHWFIVSCGGIPVERRVKIQKATVVEKVASIVRPFNS